MFDMSKIKAVCFDFDSTLCCWRTHSRSDCPVSRKECARKGENYYEFEDENGAWFTKYTVMQKFIDKYCKELPCFLTSACEEHAQKMKQDWVERNYLFNIENRCVKSIHSKLPMLHSIAMETGYDASEILVVDDNMDDVIYDAHMAGFATATPADVAQFLFDNGDIS